MAIYFFFYFVRAFMCSYIFFYTWTFMCPFIFLLFSYFWIAHDSSTKTHNFRERSLSFKTWTIYVVEPNKHIFVSPSVGIEHIWVDPNGKHVFAYSQYRSRTYMPHVRDLDLGSMINFSTRVTRFDQTQHNNKQHM